MRARLVLKQMWWVSQARDRTAKVTQWLSIPVDVVEHEAALNNAGYKKKMRVLEVKRAPWPIDWTSVTGMQWQIRLPKKWAQNLTKRKRCSTICARMDFRIISRQVIGKGGVQAKWGKLVALGRPLPPQVRRSGQSNGQQLLLAYQAQLFNRWTAARVEDGLWSQVLAGDVVETGGNRLPQE